MILVFIRVHSRILIRVYIYSIKSTENSRVPHTIDLLAPQCDTRSFYKGFVCDESTRFGKSRQERIPPSHEDPG